MSLKTWNKEINNFNEKFKKVDKNNDKKITKKEIMEALGYDEETYNKSSYKNFFESRDADKNGEVTEAELYDFFETKVSKYFIKDVLMEINESDTYSYAVREKNEVLAMIKETLKEKGLDDKNADYALKLVSGLIEKEGKITVVTIGVGIK
ncbi:hypothetical protein ACTA71_003733 [Dictyostelium dimigraforme]